MIAAVWFTDRKTTPKDPGSRRWRCDECRRRPDLRAQRGDCGGPFDLALEGARLTDTGEVEVRGAEVILGAHDMPAWTSCPVAAAEGDEAQAVLALYCRLRDGRLLETPRLTAAGTAALDAAASAEGALRQHQRRRVEAFEGKG